MTRPSQIHIDVSALLHNIQRVKQCAPQQNIIAMVKANAYGCGLAAVVPVLDAHVDAFGVACLEEALAIRALGSRRDCVLLQGVFDKEELALLLTHHIQCVIHQPYQLEWLVTNPLAGTLKVWVKIDTGMHRLGFEPAALGGIIDRLRHCPWIDKDIGVMTHFACADTPSHATNAVQLQLFNEATSGIPHITRSIANSAAILALPDTHADTVRPGIMLYGVSPFSNQIGQDFDLMPVMHFTSAITAIHDYPPHAPIGYGGTWASHKPSVIGVVPVGYGDGYPRHVSPSTPVFINGTIAPIVGRISMDMLTVDITHCPSVAMGDTVELWGKHIPIETIAASAGTIAYELLCQVTQRVCQQTVLDGRIRSQHTLI